jgi:hypothetical protein
MFSFKILYVTSEAFKIPKAIDTHLKFRAASDNRNFQQWNIGYQY